MSRRAASRGAARMSLRMALALVLVLWAVGAAFFPLRGMIHFLLIVALILVIVDRVGRG